MELIWFIIVLLYILCGLHSKEIIFIAPLPGPYGLALLLIESNLNKFSGSYI